MRSRKTKINLTLLAALLIAGGVAVFYASRDASIRLDAGDTQPRREEADRMAVADRAAKDRVGAVDVAHAPVQLSPYAAPAPATVDAKSTMEAKRAALSAKSGVHPERVSAAIPAQPFDLKAWSDPKSPYRSWYLTNPEMGRVWQPLPADAKTPQLAVVGGDFFRLKANPAKSKINTEVSFTIKGIPDAPVSASCFDGAYFSKSQISTATLATDKDGQAKFTVEIPAGVTGQMKVICASPMMSGQVKVTLDIKP